MVAMSVWPTDAADGSVANEARWRKMARFWTPSGVLAGVGGSMVPTLAMPNLTVQAGAAWVDGHYTELAGAQVLAVTANGIAVIRFDPAANTAELLWRDGITTPTQNVGGVWEIVIAQITGSVMTDLRRLMSPTNPSGINTYVTETQTAAQTGNGTLVDFTPLLLPSRGAGFASITIATKMHNGTAAMAFDLRFTASAAGNVAAAGPYGVNVPTSALGVGAWVPVPSVTLFTPTTPGVKPNAACTVFVGSPGAQWYLAARINVVEYLT